MGSAVRWLGARELLDRLPALLGASVRVIPAPCIGRCEQAPAAVVHQNPMAFATIETVAQAVKANARTHHHDDYLGLESYIKAGGYAPAARLPLG